MSTNNNQRNFYIFNPEDLGFGTTCEPSGYIKMEIKDDFAKLYASVRNLKENLAEYDYILCIIKCDSTGFNLISTGYIKLQNNKGELLWKFNPSNVGDSGFNIDEFNIFAVIARSVENKNYEIHCPLVIYKNEKIDWKNKVIPVLYNQDTNNTNTKEQNPQYEKVSAHESAKTRHAITGNNASYIETNQNSTGNSYKISTPCEEIQRNSNENPIKINASQKYFYNHNCKKPRPICNMNNSNHNNMICPRYFQGNIVCAACKESSLPQSLTKIEEAFKKYFEPCKPFQNSRKDYEWWKVSSPIYLSSILYKYNIRKPILSNKHILHANIKYNHLITGIYFDTTRMLKYVVCGVPGMYQIDENPFMETSKWVPLEDCTPSPGMPGYWLIYFDYDTGKIIDIS